MDTLYAAQRSTRANLRILGWTAVVLFFRRDVAVNRATGELGVRRRPSPALVPSPPSRRPLDRRRAVRR